MTATRPHKRKVSVTLDADIVELFESEGSLSNELNDALRSEADRRHRLGDLRDFVVVLDEVHGPFDSESDRADIERYRRLFR